LKTKTGELSIKATKMRLLTKSLRPLPDKFHGMADQEQKYRQRYVDLMTDEEARKRFVAAARRGRHPRLHGRARLPGSRNADAAPHPRRRQRQALHHPPQRAGQEMYLRIAPELYLKRLVVGGFERVFEINRNFRNEGISVRHNPEFTMMEFYAAYWNYQDLMDFTEKLIRDAAIKAVGTLELSYGGKPVDLAKPFERLTIPEAIVKYTAGDNVANREWLTNALKKLGMKEDKDKLSTRTLASLQVLYFEGWWKRSCGTPPSSWSTPPRSRRWRAPTTSAPK
jgi:lysyl-tRNA synthetase class 2